jgi:crossover junction endodeoxyribonuclease RusA
MSITFHVEGIAAPQGSKTRTRYGMFESSKRVKPWRELVKAAAMRAGDDAALLGPLQPPYRVEMWFFIAKPRTTRSAHPVAPTVGDLDKLFRAVGDALVQGGLIEDDRHIIKLTAEKAWAVGEKPGVIVRVSEI